MIGMKLRFEKRDSPTASPTTSPITTDIANATASSQNVMRNAAGTPRVSNSAPSVASTRDGGLRNIGSIHQRADDLPEQEQPGTTSSRASAGTAQQRALDGAEPAVVLIIAASPGVRARW